MVFCCFLLFFFHLGHWPRDGASIRNARSGRFRWPSGDVAASGSFFFVLQSNCFVSSACCCCSCSFFSSWQCGVANRAMRRQIMRIHRRFGDFLLFSSFFFVVVVGVFFFFFFFFFFHRLPSGRRSRSQKCSRKRSSELATSQKRRPHASATLQRPKRHTNRFLCLFFVLCFPRNATPEKEDAGLDDSVKQFGNVAKIKKKRRKRNASPRLPNRFLAEAKTKVSFVFGVLRRSRLIRR